MSEHSDLTPEEAARQLLEILKAFEKTMNISASGNVPKNPINSLAELYVAGDEEARRIWHMTEGLFAVAELCKMLGSLAAARIVRHYIENKTVPDGLPALLATDHDSGHLGAVTRYGYVFGMKSIIGIMQKVIGFEKILIDTDLVEKIINGVGGIDAESGNDFAKSNSARTLESLIKPEIVQLIIEMPDNNQ